MSSRTGLAALCTTVGLGLALSLPLGQPDQAPTRSHLATAAITPLARSVTARVSAHNLSRSQRAHRGLSPAHARALAARSFPQQLTGPAQGQARLGPGVSIRRYVSEYTAQISNGKQRGLLVSTLPLRARTHGRLQAVDLRLQRQGAGFSPLTALLPTTLPARLNDACGSDGS